MGNMKNIKKLFFVLALVFASCGSGSQNTGTPIFTNPDVKLAALASPTFTAGLVSQATTLEPLVTTSGSQISMGYWSAAGNRDALVRVLDSINATASTATPPQRGIWDEGVATNTSSQYPAYVTMNNEYWYDRKDFVNHRGRINGIIYTDPYVVTLALADDIWGGYSQRYADMATAIKSATGDTVKVWCFVNGAKINRVFFKYEFPELQILEAAGVVQVFFANTVNSDWTNPSDWKEGTENAPTPLPANLSAVPSISKDPVYSTELKDDIAFDIADVYLDGEFGSGADAREAALKEFARRNPGFTEAEYEEAFTKAVVMAAF